jgi:hypothetical protein
MRNFIDIINEGDRDETVQNKTWFRVRGTIHNADGKVMSHYVQNKGTKAALMREVNKNRDGWREDYTFTGTLQQFAGTLSHASEPEGLIAEQLLKLRAATRRGAS